MFICLPTYAQLNCRSVAAYEAALPTIHINVF